jgi:hypothetical protein
MEKQQGIVKDGRGQDQPKTKADAQELGVKKPTGEKLQSQQPGVKEQKESAEQQVESPGEPAGGE